MVQLLNVILSLVLKTYTNRNVIKSSQLCADGVTFLVRTGITALHDGHTQENNVQRAKHSAELAARAHPHCGSLPKSDHRTCTGWTKSLC